MTDERIIGAAKGHLSAFVAQDDNDVSFRDAMWAVVNRLEAAESRALSEDEAEAVLGLVSAIHNRRALDFAPANVSAKRHMESLLQAMAIEEQALTAPALTTLMERLHK